MLLRLAALIRHLENTLALADELNDGTTGYLIYVHSTMGAHHNSNRSLPRRESKDVQVPKSRNRRLT
jgi:hypothetical protein